MKSKERTLKGPLRLDQANSSRKRRLTVKIQKYLSLNTHIYAICRGFQVSGDSACRLVGILLTYLKESRYRKENMNQKMDRETRNLYQIFVWVII